MVVGDRPAVLGRAPECELALPHESISRRHARVWRQGSGFLIEDLGSKNGIRVNTYATQRQGLRHGDRIDLGAVRLQVEIGPARRDLRTSVVFEDERDPKLHTELLDMDRVDSLFEVPAAPNAAPPPGDPASPLSQEQGVARLFSSAAQALLSSDSLDETLERILELVFRNFPAERGVICLYDEETDRSEPRVFRTREGVPERPIAISTHVANTATKRKQAVMVRDTLSDEQLRSAESVIRMHIHSAMCVPLYHAGRVVGFIYLDRQNPRSRFQTQHLHMLSALAVLSAVAVREAELREGIRREKEIRARLERYSSPAVVNRIIEGAPDAAMVAEEAEVTVVFADLAGFTGLAETLRSSDVVQLLNQVLERLTEAVFEYEGTLDKFRGDGLMAFFGAPLALPDHAQRAIDSALRMQELVQELNAVSGQGHPLTVRIGINSGPVVVGDVGSPQRRDYTVIGDVVNTASRLESSVARPGQVVIGPETHALAGSHFRCQQLDEVVLKGKRQRVRPFLVLGRAEDRARSSR